MYYLYPRMELHFVIFLVLLYPSYVIEIHGFSSKFIKHVLIQGTYFLFFLMRCTAPHWSLVTGVSFHIFGGVDIVSGGKREKMSKNSVYRLVFYNMLPAIGLISFGQNCYIQG